MRTKVRKHREWFRPVERGGRKSCPSCKTKLEPGEWIWCWGEYVRGKWHNVKDVCKACWPSAREELNRHAGGCGCEIVLTPYHATLPAWLTLETDNGTHAQGSDSPHAVLEALLPVD